MNIRERIRELTEEAVGWRRDIHQHPELGYEEKRTSQLVTDILTASNIIAHRGLAKTGVVGVLKCGSSPRSIALRADMDALALPEANSFSYRSVHENKMHACGHDGHTAILLGAARYLAGSRNFDGTVYFIFQPAEEGGGGAEAMIKDGLFERFPCDVIYGMHNLPGLPVGHFAMCTGPMMASFDSFDITIEGVGGHAAMPHLTIDPVVVAANLITVLPTIIARNINPTHAAVLSISHIKSGEPTYNVIPDKVVIKGCVRTLQPDTRSLVKHRVKTLVEGMCVTFGAKCRLDYNPLYPVLINSSEEIEHASRAAIGVVGKEAVDTDCSPMMGSEDFAAMLQQKPGAYLFIGNGDGEGNCMIHNPGYDFNDEIIPIGIEYWCRLVEDCLNKSIEKRC